MSTPIRRPLSADVEGLRLAECWDVLRDAAYGRLVVLDPGGAPDVFPVNHLVHGDALFVRSAPGSKLVDIAHDPRVAFEVDAVEDGVAWSVVLRGVATRMDADDEIEASGILDLISANPTEKYVFLRIEATQVNGRRFRIAVG
ncbi:pyridoxamine 5'-phosphate oxidase family protein [Microbacterium sp.]|uniref:pyridoxamine 5'-phosphate oxidase family protein n=1 Tax=Microbacterium sp. TaxID=51671 RepID=UPI0039E41F93